MADWTQDLIPIEEARTLDGLFLRRIHRSPERIAYRAASPNSSPTTAMMKSVWASGR